VDPDPIAISAGACNHRHYWRGGLPVSSSLMVLAIHAQKSDVRSNNDEKSDTHVGIA